MVDLYRTADVFALPSIVMGNYGRQDVIPNVLAEAMAVGVPVIVAVAVGVGRKNATTWLVCRSTSARMWNIPATAATTSSATPAHRK